MTNHDEHTVKAFHEYVDGLKASNDKSLVIPLLQYMQNHFGYIPREMVTYASKELKIPTADIYGVATFYAQFSFEPKGKYTVSVCLGTACYVKGAQNVLDELSRVLDIKDGETTKDRQFSLENVRCMGCCGVAPAVQVNDHVYAHVKVNQVPEIIQNTLEAKHDKDN